MDVAAGWPILSALIPICFLAGLVSGIAGFAFGVVAIALMLPLGLGVSMVPVALAGSVLSQLVALRTFRRTIDWKRLWPFLLPGLVGVPIGTAALRWANPHAFRLSLGALLVTFALYGLVRGRGRPVTLGGRGADAAIGLIGGAMGGYAGLSGVAPTIWCGLRGWPRDEQRAIYQPFILIIQATALVAGGSADLFPAGALTIAAICAAPVAIGTWCGMRIYRRMDERLFRRAVLLLLLVSGLAQLV